MLYWRGILDTLKVSNKGTGTITRVKHVIANDAIKYMLSLLYTVRGDIATTLSEKNQILNKCDALAFLLSMLSIWTVHMGYVGEVPKKILIRLHYMPG